MTRAPWQGEPGFLRTSIPGSFSFTPLLVDSYAVRVSAIPKGVYVKELTYGGHNLQAEPLQAGAAIGDTKLRVVLARDGGTVAAKVADKDGNAISDARVLVLPISVASEAALAAAIVSGQCDQNGLDIEHDGSREVLRPGAFEASQQQPGKHQQTLGQSHAFQRNRTCAERQRASDTRADESRLIRNLADRAAKFDAVAQAEVLVDLPRRVGAGSACRSGCRGRCCPAGRGTARSPSGCRRAATASSSAQRSTARSSSPGMRAPRASSAIRTMPACDVIGMMPGDDRHLDAGQVAALAEVVEVAVVEEELRADVVRARRPPSPSGSPSP